MTASAPVFINRPDTFFGVCEAIGQDFGFNPNILRVALGAGVLVNPLAVVVSYVGLGILVAVSRLIVPSVPKARAAANVPAVCEADNDAGSEALAAAA